MNITLTVDHYYEYFLTILGWVISNGIWDLLTQTGIMAIPFLAHIISSFLKVREQGDDEGNKGRLLANWLENKIYISLVVMMLTCVPLFNVSYNTLQFNTERMRQCGFTVYKASETGLSGLSSELGGKSPALPLWWAFTYTVGKGLTHGAIATLPCKPDLRQVRFEIQNTQITSPVLRQEVLDFVQQCFIPARAKIKRKQLELDEEQARDLDWIGSKLMLKTEGLYDAYRAQTPRKQWPYDANRDQGLPNTGNGGFPSCKEWWSDSQIGLKARLVEQVEPDTMTKLRKIWNSKEDYTDIVVRRLVSPQNMRASTGRVYGGYGDSNASSIGASSGSSWMTYVASSLGSAAGSIVTAPVFDVIKQSLPMVQGIMLMAIMICMPVIAVIGSYDVKTIITMTLVQFGIFFLSFWWELARWLDNWMIITIYSSDAHPLFNAFGIMNDSDDGILSVVINIMYILLPMLFLGALSWAGVNAGAALSNIISNSSDKTMRSTDTDKIPKK
ncbi:conjugal transfer protein TraG [Haemophilus paracuniculus]|uniref:Conjugal transfer protein TraG n=1 Tax=Haemophilus paracuniculus TaxID=734 RepID=A0A1T0AW06_9PAST|nr:conjugal transfer protein TraG N-terminal domain-containing protein [Haemophilus paracuniculus]OOS00883.1 conjugal transfer protein TraG [Haemophilus paracuniculus]